MPSHPPTHPATDLRGVRPVPTGKVVACIDDSAHAEAVCDYAAWSAHRMEAPLSLLHVIDSTPTVGRTPQNLSGSIGLGARERLLQELTSLDEARARIAVEHGRHLLAAARSRVEEVLEALGPPAVSLEAGQRHGELVETLLELEAGIRMVVVGKQGAESTAGPGHLGRNLERIIRTVGKPILIAQRSFSPPRRIMFAYDGSPTARKGLEMVAVSPLFRGIPCHLVHVGADRPEAREALASASATLQASGFEAPVALVPGNPEEALPRYQEEHGIELLVMGAYGHSRIRHLIVGSTTTAMIRSCTVSLMVLR